MLKQLKLVVAMISLGCTLIALPAKAEWEWDPEYLKPKFESLVKSAIEKGKIKLAKESQGSGTPQDSSCNSIEIQGHTTWSEGESGYGKPYYIWSSSGMSVECWELIKKGMLNTPFNLGCVDVHQYFI